MGGVVYLRHTDRARIRTAYRNLRHNLNCLPASTARDWLLMKLAAHEAYAFAHLDGKPMPDEIVNSLAEVFSDGA